VKFHELCAQQFRAEVALTLTKRSVIQFTGTATASASKSIRGLAFRASGHQAFFWLDGFE
jgi:hypothetical protein